MVDEPIEDRLNKIATEVTNLAEKLSNKKKDWWDRLSALSPFIGGVLVAGVGLYFTVTSQQRQIEINEVDLAVKFFPYLTAKDSETRTQAFSVIQAVGGNLLISRLATLGGKSAEPALLTAQSQSTDPLVKQFAKQALENVNVVAQIQAKLGLTPDGILGSQTRSAIAEFQLKNGLSGTGIIDPLTIKKVNELPAR